MRANLGWAVLLLATGGFCLAQAPVAPPTPVVAGATVKFQFTPGQVLTYSVEQVTTVTETTPDEKTKAPTAAASSTRLMLQRRWTVKAVDPAGTATLEMAIVSMKQQFHRPGPPDAAGKPTVDKIVMDSSTPEGKAQMAAFLDKPIVTVKLDSAGKLLEATGTNPAAAARLSAELPFRVVLPPTLPAVGGVWSREFSITLDPPVGTGEKYEATQTYSFKGDNQGHAVLGIGTALKAPPKDGATQAALTPFLWEGEAFFQASTGRYAGARLKVERTVRNHQGPDSELKYESQYTEALAP